MLFKPFAKAGAAIKPHEATDFEEGLFVSDDQPLTTFSKMAKETVLIYAGPGDFPINLDYCEEINEKLRQAEIPSYYIMQKTFPKAVQTMALNDGIETVVSICTSRNKAVPAMNGQEVFTTSRKSYLLGVHITQALAALPLIRAFPQIHNEPSNSPSWTAAKHGLTLARINLGYLSNYYDADLIINHRKELSAAIARGIEKYIKSQPKRGEAA